MRFHPTVPIHSLPVELLSYILELGTHSPERSPNGRQESLPFNTESVRAPLIFSAVCRRWRDVAQTTSSLWTSICITSGSIRSSSVDQTSKLDLSNVIAYLSLSRKYPLNILLDARDIDWDFCEPDVPTISDYLDYDPPFSESDMRTAVSLLLPHISRWRSVEILTDTWAPMHAALRMINEPLVTRGAPMLQSLILMRCNDYVSHSPLFQPSSMKQPALFQSDGFSEASHPLALPLIQNLTLRGVHVDWSGLSSSLGLSLTALELSSHSLDVQPTHSELHSLLSGCPKLESLTFNGSGFVIDDEDLSFKTGAHDLSENMEPIRLPFLEELRIGYRSALDGYNILSMLHVPNIVHLSLEDATHPGEAEQVAADPFLHYIAATLKRNQNKKTITPFYSPSSTSPASCSCTNPTLSSFANLRKLTLRAMKAQPSSFRKFFISMPHLQSLELREMPRPMDVVLAIASSKHIDSSQVSSTGSPSSLLPCPLLEELSLNGELSTDDFKHFIDDFLGARTRAGARPLKRLDIHLIDALESAFYRSDGLTIRIFSTTEDDETGFVSHSSRSADDELDEAFAYGGVFNDPIFDAQYGGAVLAH
ncbi:hypothetical protein D9757_010007 [Collybiopsis confluens]|uniref:F-box domain-containing protein n=1 Tax=Collybiopsis confluens TaxID=2823264 RepID=A0A8H5GUR9_9AGAR|nr:hypothetical protein D9757_010007 [Collybiopsis confluens]